MVVVGYFDGIDRRGMLAWVQGDEGALEALGGFDPGDEAAAREPLTVVTTDDGTRMLAGWVHPDHIAEVSGQDGPEVRVTVESVRCPKCQGVGEVRYGRTLVRCPACG